MFTKSEKVTGTVEIWARPRYSWDEGTDPFVYQLGKAYSPGSVKVAEHAVSLDVPAGINLYLAALSTLEAEKEEIQEKADKEKAKVDVQIQSLRLLAAPAETTPELDDIVLSADVVGAQDPYKHTDLEPPTEYTICKHGIPSYADCDACDHDIPF